MRVKEETSLKSEWINEQTNKRINKWMREQWMNEQATVIMFVTGKEEVNKTYTSTC